MLASACDVHVEIARVRPTDDAAVLDPADGSPDNDDTAVDDVVLEPADVPMAALDVAAAPLDAGSATDGAMPRRPPRRDAGRVDPRDAAVIVPPTCPLDGGAFAGHRMNPNDPCGTSRRPRH
jgi:hypothetical protein